MLRLRYVGLLFYAAELFSAITGMAFILMVTRSLTVSEFGEWQIFSLVLSYTTFLYDAFPFWSARFKARGYKESIVTGLTINVLLALIIDVILILSLNIISKSLLIRYQLLMIVALFTLVTHVHRALYQGVYIARTEKVAISVIIFELTKVLFCFVLTFFTELGIYGVVFSVLIADIFQIIYLALYDWEDLKQKPSFKLVKTWMHVAWLSIYQYVGGLFLILDIPIMIFYTGSKEIAAFYTVGASFSSTILYTRFLASGLYPKLLASGSKKDVEETLKLSMLLAVPSTVAILVLSPYLLYILKPEYSLAYNVLRIMAVDSFLIVLMDIFVSTLLGIEKIDVESAGFKKVIKSYFFLTSSTTYIKAGILLSSLCVLLFLDKNLGMIQISEYAKLFSFIASLTVLVILLLKVKKGISFKFPMKNLLNYLVASIIMGLIVAQFQPFKIRDLVLTVVIGVGVYFSVLYVLDSWFRSLARRIYDELKYKLKPASRELTMNGSGESTVLS